MKSLKQVKQVQENAVLLDTVDGDLGAILPRAIARDHAVEYALAHSVDVYVRDVVSDRVLYIVRWKHLRVHKKNSECTSACKGWHA